MDLYKKGRLNYITMEIVAKDVNLITRGIKGIERDFFEYNSFICR